MRLIDDGCEIWIAGLDDFATHQSALDAVLTPEEREHVERVHHGRATTRLSRGLLRLLLARYLHRSPAEIGIDRSCPDCRRAHGRPRLHHRIGSANETMEFSVTHGGDLLVLAFADQAPIGVDVEPLDVTSDVSADLVDFTLTPAERARLQDLPATQRRQMFLRSWTAKEAILKALGTGLDVEPQAVTLPDPIAGAVSVRLPGAGPVALWLKSVDVGAAHVCTLATGHEVRALTTTRLRPDLVFDAGT